MHEVNRHILASRSGVVVTALTSLADASPWRPFWQRESRHLETDLDFYSLVIGSRAEVRGPYLLGALGESGLCGMLIGRVEEASLPVKLGYFTLGRLPVRQLVFVSDAMLGERTPERAELFLAALVQALRMGHADVVVLENLPQESPLLGACLAQPRPVRGLAQRSTEHWRGTVAASADQFLQKLSKRHRYKLRHALKKFESQFAGQVRYERYQGLTDVSAFCAAAETVMASTYQRGLGVGFRDDPQCRGLVQLSADRGWWAAWTLFLGNRPIAFWAGMIYAGCYHVEWTAFDPAYAEFEPGSILFLRVIDELGKAGAQRIDFGIGSALYKERFGDDLKIETSYRLFAPGFKGLSSNLCFSGGLFLERCSHAVLQRLRLADRIKRLLRARAEARAAQDG